MIRRLYLLAACVVAGVCAATTAGAQSACADLGGTVETPGTAGTAGQTCHVHGFTTSYTTDISFPTDYPDQQSVGQFLKQDRDAFVEWVTDNGARGRGRVYQYVVTGKAYRSAGTQSLVLKIENDSGLAHEGHPDTLFKTFAYDLNRRAPITFESLFRAGSQPLDVLNPIVQRELQAPVATLDASKYRNFAITDDAIVFFFGENQVITDDNGPHQVSVPRADIASILA